MLFYIIFIIAGILLDQLTKYLAVTFLTSVSTVPIIPHVFHLTYVANTGAAFSILEGKQTFLIIMTFIFVTVLAYFFAVMPKTRKYFDVNFALSMIISGAIGNLIDRVRLHYVVDFFDVRLIGFAIFNIADIFVVVGCILIIIALFRNKELLNDPPPTLKKKSKFTRKKVKKESDVKAQDIPENSHKNVLPQQKTQKKKTAPIWNPRL